MCSWRPYNQPLFSARAPITPTPPRCASRLSERPHLRNREATELPGPQHEGILLYPVVDELVRVDVYLEGFSIGARSIDLAKDWREIHAEMLDVVA